MAAWARSFPHQRASVTISRNGGSFSIWSPTTGWLGEAARRARVWPSHRRGRLRRSGPHPESGPGRTGFAGAHTGAANKRYPRLSGCIGEPKHLVTQALTTCRPTPPTGLAHCCECFLPFCGARGTAQQAAAFRTKAKGFFSMPQGKAKTAAAKRKEAARARRLALSLSEQNQASLLEYATKLEAEADALESAETTAKRKKDQRKQ